MKSIKYYIQYLGNFMPSAGKKGIHQLLILVFAGSILSCGGAKKEVEAFAALVKGNALITSGGKQETLKAGQTIGVGDTITTGTSATVIIEYKNFAGKLEVQENTVFTFARGGSAKELFLETGNVWTQVTKLGKEQKFLLRTPSTVAGVRGTKFYSFYNNQYTGVCHCEGKIEYTNLKNGKANVNEKDYLVMHKGDKSIILYDEDYKKMKIRGGHEHSSIDDSPVGKKVTLTPDELKRFFAYVDKKFSEVKN